MTAATPGQAAQEFTGWAEAQGYVVTDHGTYGDMAGAFAAGMQAARDLAAPDARPAALSGLVEQWRERHREFSDAGIANDDQEIGRGQITTGVAFRKCADALAEVIAAQGARPAPGSAGVLSVSRGDGTPGGGLMAYVRTEPKPDCDGSAEPQPAPGLAAATDETRGYREALEHVRAIILEGDNSTEGSRLRRSRAVIRAALEGK